MTIQIFFMLPMEITESELETVITHNKNGKRGGGDLIPSECFKNLPRSWKIYISVVLINYQLSFTPANKISKYHDM